MQFCQLFMGGAGRITTFRRVWSTTQAASDVSNVSDSSEALGTDWAAAGVFAELLYSTYSEKYFEDWSATYDPMGRDGFALDWVRYDYGKPGSGGQDRQSRPNLVDAWTYDSKYDENTVCGSCFPLRCLAWQCTLINVLMLAV